MPEDMTFGSVIFTAVDGKQEEYDNATNVSLGKDWAFIRFVDGSRVQIPVMIIRELYEDNGVFVKGVKKDD
jgi:hypothetical protein